QGAEACSTPRPIAKTDASLNPKARRSFSWRQPFSTGRAERPRCELRALVLEKCVLRPIQSLGDFLRVLPLSRSRAADCVGVVALQQIPVSLLDFFRRRLCANAQDLVRSAVDPNAPERERR